MYDILQLNDMLVPELLDIAEELHIDNPKKLDKQELIYKILDKQAVMGSATKADSDGKPKRKRIVKASTANTTEEAIVEDTSVEVEKKAAAPKKAAAVKKEAPKKPVKKKAAEDEMVEAEKEEAPDGSIKRIRIPCCCRRNTC